MIEVSDTVFRVTTWPPLWWLAGWVAFKVVAQRIA